MMKLAFNRVDFSDLLGPASDDSGLHSASLLSCSFGLLKSKSGKYRKCREVCSQAFELFGAALITPHNYLLFSEPREL